MGPLLSIIVPEKPDVQSDVAEFMQINAHTCKLIFHLFIYFLSVRRFSKHPSFKETFHGSGFTWLKVNTSIIGYKLNGPGHPLLSDSATVKTHK